MENEKIENVEAVEEKAMAVVEENKNGLVQGLDAIGSRSMTNCKIYTNIKDRKKLFNLENGENISLLNDCEGEKLRIMGVLIKTYEKPLPQDKIIYDEETGEIIKDTETTMSCVLVDESEKAYATGSKMFIIQLMRYIQNFGYSWENEGLEIEIIKKKMQNSNNKCLAFKLI